MNTAELKPAKEDLKKRILAYLNITPVKHEKDILENKDFLKSCNILYSDIYIGVLSKKNWPIDDIKHYIYHYLQNREDGLEIFLKIFIASIDEVNRAKEIERIKANIETVKNVIIPGLTPEDDKEIKPFDNHLKILKARKACVELLLTSIDKASLIEKINGIKAKIKEIEEVEKNKETTLFNNHLETLEDLYNQILTIANNHLKTLEKDLQNASDNQIADDRKNFFLSDYEFRCTIRDVLIMHPKFMIEHYSSYEDSLITKETDTNSGDQFLKQKKEIEEKSYKDNKERRVMGTSLSYIDRQVINPQAGVWMIHPSISGVDYKTEGTKANLINIDEKPQENLSKPNNNQTQTTEHKYNKTEMDSRFMR